MTTLNGKLQNRLSDGSWIDCDKRTEEFLNKCEKNDYREYTMDQIIIKLNAGVKIRNDVSDWYSECRIKPVETPAPTLTEWQPDTEDYGY